MTLSDLSIKKPVFAWMLMAGLLVFGGICYSLMGISQLPDVDFPVVTVTVTWQGASPDVMETAVADPIEDAVMSVDGVTLVQSTSQQGQTQIIIQLNLDQDINVALLQVQTKVTQAQKNLPQTIDPPIITKTNPSDQPILWAAVYAKDSSLRQMVMFVRDHLKASLTTISGVGDVQYGGYVDPQMRVWMKRDEMEKRDVTFQDVIDAINNEHQLAPTGYQDKGDKENYVRVFSEFTDAKSCEDLVIPARQGKPLFRVIKLKEVAACQEGTDEVRKASRFNGIQPTVGLGIIKQHGTNAVQIGDTVKKRIKNMQDILPAGMAMDVVTDTTVFIRDSIHELLSTLGISVILTSIVCYLFLGSLSSAFNVVLAIPVSLIGSFIVLKFLGFTVNTFTLMGLSLSIGIVVDDAIMVLENISRHVEMGKHKVHAALVGAREITGPAVAASLAILAIFIPVVFMKGIVGKFFYQFGVTISVAVMISLLEALTLAPMRCSQFLHIGATNFVTKWVSNCMDKLALLYGKALGWCLHHRWKVLGTTTALFFFSLVLATGFTPFGINIIKPLRKEFMPPQDQSRFLITAYTPMGSSFQFTDNVFHELEKIYVLRKEVEKYYVSVGGLGGGLVNQGITFITMKDFDERPVQPPFKHKPTQQEFMAEFRKMLEVVPGVQRVAILDLSLTGFSAQRGYPVEFEIQGPDWNKLTDISLQMRERLKKSGLMADVDSDYNPNMPELQITPDREKAALRGVPVSTITSGIAAMVGGQKLLPNKYTDETGHREDIQVKLSSNENESPDDVNKLMVRNVMGWMVPMNQVITSKMGSSLLTVTRFNRERAIGIFGNFKPGQSLGDVVEYIQKMGKDMLPKGYKLVLSGSSQAFQESISSLMGALVLGIFVAYMVLASQFNSFLHPTIVLLALPFSITGALGMMWMMNVSVNIYSLIGILLLMGIVKKNSILLVEFTNHKRTEGLEVNQALIEACPIRLRPIIMTSVATVVAAIPEAFASGAGAEVMKPMAVALIGGVSLSTLLTLFVVPCAYSLAANLESHKHGDELKEALEAMGEAPKEHTDVSPRGEKGPAPATS